MSIKRILFFALFGALALPVAADPKPPTMLFQGRSDRKSVV